MPRRRKRSRRFTTTRAVMKRRLGMVGWGNSRPWHPWSKIITTRTLGEGHNPGTTTGAIFFLPVNNWNDPLGSLATLVAGSGSLTSNRHPMNHNNAISTGYNWAQVLSWSAKIEINWITASSPPNDFNVAYTFAQDAASEVTLVAGTEARVDNLDIETNPMWTVKRFNAAFGDTPKRGNEGVTFISVPNVFEYCDSIARGLSATEANNQTVGHLIADVSHTSGPPTIPLFCTVAIYTISGLAMPINSVHVTVAVTQRVKLMRDLIGAEDLDEGQPDVHA